MILNLNQQIDDKALNTLIDAYNSLRVTEDGKIEPLDILFSSYGGSNSVAAAIIKVINSNADITTMIGYDHLCSNGFKIFFEVECPKEILGETRGMYHLTRNDGLIVYEGNVTKNAEYDEFIKKELNSFSYLNRTHELVNFTDKELELIKNNKDAWFSTKRLQQMLKYNKSQQKNKK